MEAWGKEGIEGGMGVEQVEWEAWRMEQYYGDYPFEPNDELYETILGAVRTFGHLYYCSYFYEFSHFYNLCKNKKCASKKSD